jgi:hypothetical protein
VKNAISATMAGRRAKLRAGAISAPENGLVMDITGPWESGRKRVGEVPHLGGHPSGEDSRLHSHIMCGSAVFTCRRSAEIRTAVVLPVFFHQWATP